VSVTFVILEKKKLDSHLVISKINEVGVKDIPTLPPEAEVDACRIERKVLNNFF
jgi:hypothetical protein